MASPEPYPPCLCDDLRGDGLCLVCASTPEDREETTEPTLGEWLFAQIVMDEVFLRGGDNYLDGCQECGAGQYGWTTSRLLAECDAKRRIVQLSGGARFALDCHPDDEGEQGHVNGIDKCLRILATAYSDRDGYRAEWAPRG